jgi:hypothetical protein
MGLAERFVLRLRAGRTEVAIIPRDEGALFHPGPMGKAQVRERWKADAIEIIAQALDDPEIRAAFRDKGLQLVVVK